LGPRPPGEGRRSRRHASEQARSAPSAAITPARLVAGSQWVDVDWHTDPARVFIVSVSRAGLSEQTVLRCLDLVFAHSSEHSYTIAPPTATPSWMRLRRAGRPIARHPSQRSPRPYRWHHGIPSTRHLTCHCRSGNAPPRCLQADPNLPLGSPNRGKYVPGIRICELGRLRSCGCVPITDGDERGKWAWSTY
jgi:hypothetical protein